MTPAAQMNAERMLASWNCHCGTAYMPAMTGMMARTGPKKCPKKTPTAPHRLEKGLAALDHRRIAAERPDLLDAVLVSNSRSNMR